MDFCARLARVRQVFLDMDGTIYHGGTLFPTTRPFLDFLTGRGIGYAFLSNNSSYSVEQYIERLTKMGIAVTARHFYLSTDYTIDYLKKNHPEIRRIYLLGVPAIVPAFTEAGFVIDEDAPQAVIVAFDRTLTYERLCRAAWFLHRGVPGFATHPDVFCPTDQPTWLPDCGAITRCLEVATNTRLTVLGKPDPGLLRAAAARYGMTIDQVLMIGDRLSTDIRVGQNAGALTCHVTTPGADLVAPTDVHPDHSVRHLGELHDLWRKLPETI